MNILCQIGEARIGSHGSTLFPLPKRNVQVMDDLLNSIVQKSVKVSEVKFQDHLQIGYKSLRERESSKKALEIIQFTKNNFHEEVEQSVFFTKNI